jgi:hypothetical protein
MVTIQIFGNDSNKSKFDLGGIKRSLNSGSSCYHLDQNILSSHLLSKNLKIKISKTMFLPVVLYECETLSLILREQRRLRVFENNHMALMKLTPLPKNYGYAHSATVPLNCALNSGRFEMSDAKFGSFNKFKFKDEKVMCWVLLWLGPQKKVY